MLAATERHIPVEETFSAGRGEVQLLISASTLIMVITVIYYRYQNTLVVLTVQLYRGLNNI